MIAIVIITKRSRVTIEVILRAIKFILLGVTEFILVFFVVRIFALTVARGYCFFL
jgi:hypothetical protein